MHFKLSALTAILAASGSALAAPAANDATGQKVQTAIKDLTTQAGNLNDKLQGTTGPISIGQAIINGERDIITEKTKDIASFGLGGDVDQLTGQSQIAESDQSAVCEAVNTYVNVEEALLKTIIGEKGILSSTFLVAPIAAVLRTDEGATDTLNFGILGLVPTCADDIKPRIQDLSDTFQKAVSTYTGF